MGFHGVDGFITLSPYNIHIVSLPFDNIVHICNEQ